MKSIKPPKIAEWILYHTLQKHERDFMLGDFEEFYNEIRKNSGCIKANSWYWLQSMKLIPHLIKNFIYWRVVMLKNYIKIAFRHIKKHKGYSSINIFGLALGMACTILITLWILDELSYDRFHENANRIFRVTKLNSVSTPAPLARTMVSDYPEVECAVSISNMRMQPVKYVDDVFYEFPVLSATHDFFNIFSFPLIKGDQENVLKEPNTVVIIQSIAEKYFGNENPLNKTINIAGDDFRIDGVIADIPKNAHFHFKFLITMAGYQLNNWQNFYMSTYILLKDQSNAEALEAKLPDLITKYIYQDSNHGLKFILQPITSIHLHSNLRFELEPTSDIKNVIMFSSAAILLILIACINFMNLTTAKSIIRVKEIGIRKTIGSTRKELIRQFLGESMFMSFSALVIAIMFVFLLLPGFNNIMGTQIGFDSINLAVAIMGLIGLTVFVGILAGAYPAFYLSSFRPVKVLRGQTVKGKTSSKFRNGMVAFQFIISITLIIGTITISQQLNFVKNTNLGFDKNQVVVMKNIEPDAVKSETFKNKLLQNPNITAVSCSANLPGKGVGSNYLYTEEGDTLHLNMFFADYDFQKTLQLEMADGRFFSHKFGTDTAGIILNEHAVKAHNIQNPLGKRITFHYGRPIPVKVIGIVKDFHYRSLHSKMSSLGIVFGIDKGWGTNFISARLNTKDIRGTIQYIKESWNKVNPSLPFDYSFLDDEYASLYANEQRMSQIAIIFCFLAIVVSCLGLFGLASFMAERRTKEIGIRKVLGSSISSVVMLLSKEFIKWILVANIIAWPLAYFIMNKWLKNFAYHTDLSISIFMLSGFIVLAIALLTVSYQSIKAATANPIKALKYE